MADRDALAAYESFQFTDGPWTREVFRRGEGPAVIIVHEMPGLHPLVVRFADRVAEAGMTVFLPSLFGQPGKTASVAYALGTMAATICIRREFHIWAGKGSSPIVAWLRALARKAHAECGGKGVGAVGMCFTGGFALAMMTEPAVVAPVLSQPSMPMFGARQARRRRCGAGRDRLRPPPLRRRGSLHDRPALQGRRFCARRPVRNAEGASSANASKRSNSKTLTRSLAPECRRIRCLRSTSTIARGRRPRPRSRG